LVRALLESSEDAIIEVSLDGKIVQWNRGAERLYGYREEEMREQSLAQLAPIYEVPVIEAVLHDLKRGEIRRSETSERLRKDGNCVSVAVRRTAIRDAGGRVQGMIECARALEPMDSDSPAEKQLRLLVEQMPVMLWTTDRHLRITSNWGSGFQLSKIGPGKLVGRTVPEFLRCGDAGAGPVMRHYEALQGRRQDLSTNGRTACWIFSWSRCARRERRSAAWAWRWTLRIGSGPSSRCSIRRRMTR